MILSFLSYLCASCTALSHSLLLFSSSLCASWHGSSLKTASYILCAACSASGQPIWPSIMQQVLEEQRTSQAAPQEDLTYEGVGLEFNVFDAKPWLDQWRGGEWHAATGARNKAPTPVSSTHLSLSHTHTHTHTHTHAHTHLCRRTSPQFQARSTNQDPRELQAIHPPAVTRQQPS